MHRRSILIPINVTVITDETVTIEETVTGTGIVMIAIAETIDTMTGMGITTLTKSHDSRATAMAYRPAQLTPNAAKASIHNDHTTGETALTATTRVMATEVSTNRSFVTRLCRAIAKVTNVTVGIIDAVTMDDGVMADFHGPGK